MHTYYLTCYIILMYHDTEVVVKLSDTVEAGGCQLLDGVFCE